MGKRPQTTTKQFMLGLMFAMLVLLTGVAIIFSAAIAPPVPTRQSLRPSAVSPAAIEPAMTESIVLVPPNQTLPTPEQTQSLLAASADDPHLPPDIEQILRRGSLIVAMSQADNPPFFETNAQGQLQGLDVQMAEAIASYLGVAVQFQRTGATFEDVVDAVYRQQADLGISKLSQTLSRARRVQFSQPYITMRQGLLVNRLQFDAWVEPLEPGVTPDLFRLQGKIGAIRGSLYVSFVNQMFPDATLVEYPDWRSLIQAVMHGEVIAACRDELEIKQVLLTQPNALLQMQSFVLNGTADRIAIALPWQSTHLLGFVNQYLNTVGLDLTADQVLTESMAKPRSGT